MANIQQITIDQGTTTPVEFTHYTAVVYLAGSKSIIDDALSTKMDLTGYTAKMWISKNDAMGEVITHFDSRMSISNGKVIFSPLASDTSSIVMTSNELNAYYHLEITNGSQTYRTFEGPFKIRKEIII